MRSIGCVGAAVGRVLDDVDAETKHFGVGIHSFGGLGGGSRVCREFGRAFSFLLFLVLPTTEFMLTTEFISAIFSLIGAILAELQSFSCFWVSILVLECGILVSIREKLGSTRDVSGLVLD